MTVSEMANISDIKEKQVRKRWRDIPGATIENGVITFPEGSRYPYPKRKRNFQKRGQIKRYKLILEATEAQRFVDHTYLQMTENSFQDILNDLVRAELLEENGSQNPYGANKYKVTSGYAELEYNNMIKSLEDFAKITTPIVTSLAGITIGALTMV